MMAAMGDDFLDVRTHGFARVAVAVPEVRVADPAFNAEAHLRLLEQVHREGAHYALCPELGLSGYSCADLFFQETLLAASLAALGRVAEATAEWNLIVSVGMPLVVDDLLFNCAVTLFRGRAVAVAPKAFPPNYREFYERRWFHPAAHARAREITLLGERVPFGTDVLIAAPERFALHGSAAVTDVDLVALREDRMRQTSFGENAGQHARPFRTVVAEPSEERRSAAVYRELHRTIAPLPFVPADPAKRDARCREIFLIKATSLARRLLALPEDGRRVAIGVSGGQDSTEALLVAAHALDLLGLPRTHIFGVTMPGFGTSRETHENACALVRALGATLREIDITQIAGRVFEAIGHNPEREDHTFENVQAWTRTFLLFALTSRERGIILGTGDLSELALGWATYGGDHMSHYGINAGVPKTLVSELIRWAAEVIFKDEPEVARVLRAVLATPISPELLRLGPGGEIAQRSEELIGPYELHDFFLYYFLRFGFGPRRIARMALHAFGGRYTVAEIRRWLLVFLERFFANQFKRDCVPDAPKVGSGGSLSPRGDWRMPSDASVTAWLNEAKAIPESLERPTAVPRTTRAVSDRRTR